MSGPNIRLHQHFLRPSPSTALIILIDIQQVGFGQLVRNAQEVLCMQNVSTYDLRCAHTKICVIQSQIAAVQGEQTQYTV